ncbi:MAG: adaptor protein MecA [Oscillospiraceae bacterium]|nr:adaptor protein MecA [Oscillospiraceae bacterium]MBQ9982904.1 adaptor protein MecA [Oscillospiraceae bacterium]
MIIEKLSSLTVKVSLSQEDMASHNISFEHIQKDDINTTKLITYIVHEIKENLGLNLYSEHLYIEAFSCTNNNCILYISAIDNEINESANCTHGFIILESTSAKSIITFCTELINIFNEYNENSSLYHYKNTFRMILDINPDKFESIEETAIVNSIKYYTDKMTMIYTKEYFNLIFKKDAVNKLSGNLSF